MPRTKTERTLDLLRRLAALRVQKNCDWEKCAARLGRNADHLEALTRDYPALWEEAKAAAFAALREESMVESVVVLREQLRDGELKTKRDGAGKLASLMLRGWPKAAKPSKGQSGKTGGDLVQYALYLEGLDERELEKALAAVDRQIAAVRGKETGVPAGHADPPGADRSGRIPAMGPESGGCAATDAIAGAPGVAVLPDDA